MIPVSPEKDSSKLVLKIKEALSIADAIGIFKDSDFSERLCRCADKNIFVREGMHTYFGMHIQPLSEN